MGEEGGTGDHTLHSPFHVRTTEAESRIYLTTLLVVTAQTGAMRGWGRRAPQTGSRPKSPACMTQHDAGPGCGPPLTLRAGEWGPIRAQKDSSPQTRVDQGEASRITGSSSRFQPAPGGRLRNLPAHSPFLSFLGLIESYPLSRPVQITARHKQCGTASKER